MDSVAAALEVGKLLDRFSNLIISFLLVVPDHVNNSDLCFEMSVSFKLLDVPFVMVCDRECGGRVVCVHDRPSVTKGVSDEFGFLEGGWSNCSLGMVGWLDSWG